MKKSLIALIVLIITAFSGDHQVKDGIYRGSSRSFYTNEPYYGHVNLTIEKGKIIHIEFCIRDSATHEFFDDQYEKHFTGNDLYIQQCRNDWKGSITYPKRLLKQQDINKVDVISGATWSYNIFKASVEEALKKAEESEQ